MGVHVSTGGSSRAFSLESITEFDALEGETRDGPVVVAGVHTGLPVSFGGGGWGLCRVSLSEVSHVREGGEHRGVTGPLERPGCLEGLTTGRKGSEHGTLCGHRTRV